MSAYGITPYLRDRLAGAMCGTGFVLTTVGVGLHTGFPGINGLLDPSAIGELGVGSLTNVNGLIETTSGIDYVGVSNEVVSSYSVWDGIDIDDTSGHPTGNLLWIGPLTNPQQLAANDRFTINEIYLPLTLGLAAA